MAGISLSAQFVNNGATVTIQSGATLRVETDFINNSGTVTNNGTIEVQNNFTNAATFTSASGSTVKFIGTTNSNVTPGGATFQNVSLEKTNQNITLMGNMAVAGTLTFTNDNNKVILGTNNLTINAGGSLTSADENEYVVADNTGILIKGITTNGIITHEIGDASNYSPLSSVVSGSAYSSATLGARVVDAVHPSKPADADSYLSRYWVVNASGITDYANTMTGTYALTGDANGTTNDIKGATYHTADWHFTGTAANTGTPSVTVSTTTNAVDFTGMNALNKVDLTAFLYGAMPVSGTTMTNNLQVYDPPATPTLLPITSQYGAPTATYSDIGNPSGVAGAVTDWVKVEIRDAANPATILETKSLLLKTNGHIVDPTGSIPYFKGHTAPVRYAIHHRNHLAVLSNSTGSVFEGMNTTYNFSSGLAQASNDFMDPDQMRIKNGVWCLVSGDRNSDFYIDANDFPAFITSFNNGDYAIYTNTDLNLDGYVDANDFPYILQSFNTGYYSTFINY